MKNLNNIFIKIFNWAEVEDFFSVELIEEASLLASNKIASLVEKANNEKAQYEKKYWTPVNPGCTYQHINEGLNIDINLAIFDEIKNILKK